MLIIYSTRTLNNVYLDDIDILMTQISILIRHQGLLIFNLCNTFYYRI